MFQASAQILFYLLEIRSDKIWAEAAWDMRGGKAKPYCTCKGEIPIAFHYFARHFMYVVVLTSVISCTTASQLATVGRVTEL